MQGVYWNDDEIKLYVQEAEIATEEVKTGIFQRSWLVDCPSGNGYHLLFDVWDRRGSTPVMIFEQSIENGTDLPGQHFSLEHALEVQNELMSIPPVPTDNEAEAVAAVWKAFILIQVENEATEHQAFFAALSELAESMGIEPGENSYLQ